MTVLRKLLAVLAALFSILLIFLTLRAIGLNLSTYHPSSLFDRIASWLIVAGLGALSFLLMRFASRTLR